MVDVNSSYGALWHAAREALSLKPGYKHIQSDGHISIVPSTAGPVLRHVSLYSELFPDAVSHEVPQPVPSYQCIILKEDPGVCAKNK